jgi:5-methylcytosine-specific restriction protein A
MSSFVLLLLRRKFACFAQAFLFMPTAPQHPCNTPGCGVLTDAGRCPQHRQQTQRAQDQQRGSAHKRGYGARWQKASKAYLRAHPLCQCPECDEGRKRVTLATVVDHIIPHRGDMTLFWNPSNWQSMSKPCHDSKTAREDGGFGRDPGGGSKV